MDSGEGEWQLLAQGAEARVYEVENFLGRSCIVKERFAKSYRCGRTPYAKLA
jgi:tRNA A-37 threonylcarbamoyl transferase component Bud32